MFASLQKMLRPGDTITVNIARENDTQLRVNVYPKLFTLDGDKGDDRKALNTPLSIVATPEELDSPAFLETLEKFAASTNMLRHTLDEVTAEHDKAAAAAKAKAPAKAKAGEKPAAKPADKPAKPEEPPPAKTAAEATPELI